MTLCPSPLALLLLAKLPGVIRTEEKAATVLTYIPLEGCISPAQRRKQLFIIQLIHVSLWQGVLCSLQRWDGALTRLLKCVPSEACKGPARGGQAPPVQVLQQVSGNRRITQVFPLQEHVNLTESWAVSIWPLPALTHKVKDLLRTIGGLRQQYLLENK